MQIETGTQNTMHPQAEAVFGTCSLVIIVCHLHRDGEVKCLQDFLVQ